MPKKHRDNDKERRHKGHEDVDAELAKPDELERVREEESAPNGTGGQNIFINTMNVFGEGMRGFGRGVRMVCDPALKVCYPVAKRIAGPVRTVCDPVLKVCYPPIKTHWDTKYKERFPKHAPWVLALDLSLMFLIGALVVGLMFVKLVMPAFPQPDIVNLQLLRPTTVVSGEPTSLVLSYANDSASPLAGAELRVQLPDQFVVSDTDPAAETPALGTAQAPAHSQMLRFYLGAVPAHGSGQITINGTPYGALGADQRVISTFIFWKEGDTSAERANAFEQLSITDSKFSLGLSFDDPFLRGTRNAVRVSYGNKGDRPIQDAQVRLSAPPGFRITGSVPPTPTPGAWNVGTLQPDDSGVITVYGVLAEGAVPSFVARAYATVDDQRLLAQEIRGNVDAVSSGFTIDHAIVDPALGTAVRPGDTIHVRVRYHNGGDRTVTGASIRLEATGRYLTDTVPSWSGGDLDSIAPGATGALDAVLHVKDDITPDLLQEDATPVIHVTAVADYALADDPAKTFSIDSGATDIAVASKIGLEAAAIYRTKDGEQLGVGPIPPQAGATTRVWVVVKVSTGSGAVRNGHLEATLPPGASWTGRFSVTAGQPLAYLSEDRKLVWDIGSVPAFSDGSQAGASFELSFTPSATDVGTVPVLLRNIRMTADDAATGLKMHATSPDVTTAVRFGTDADKAGVVREKAE